jgi:hypothetical protein
MTLVIVYHYYNSVLTSVLSHSLPLRGLVGGGCSQENQMLTPKMSLRRNNVISVYAAVMQALYAGQGTSSGTVEISSLGAPKTVPYVICDLPWVRVNTVVPALMYDLDIGCFMFCRTSRRRTRRIEGRSGCKKASRRAASSASERDPLPRPTPPRRPEYNR